MPTAALASVLLVPFAISAPLTHHGIELSAFEACSIDPVGADDLALLLPDDALVIARASSLRQALRNVAQCRGETQQDDRALREFLVANSDDGAGNWVDQLDLDRACAAALAFVPGGKPEITLVLPALDPQALADSANVPWLGLSAHTAGGYVVLESSRAESPHSGAGSAVLSSLAAHDLGFHVDLRQLRRSFGPLIDMGFEQAETQIDATQTDPDASDAMLESLDDARQVWRSAETLVAALDERDGRLEATVDLALVDADWVGQRFGERRHDLRPLARLVDEDAALTTLWGGRPDVGRARGATWLGILESALGERAQPLVGLQSKVLAIGTADSDSLGVLNLSLGVDGALGSLYLSAGDPGKRSEQIASVFAAPEWGAMGLQFTGPHESTVAGTSWSSYVAAIDVAHIVESIAPGSKFAVDEQLEAQRAAESLFGRQGLRLALAAADGFAVVRLGGGERSAERAISRVHRPSPALSPQFLGALERTTDANASFVTHFDLGVLLGQASLFAAGLGEPIDLPPTLLGRRLPITVHGAISPEFARGGLSIDVFDLTRFVSALRQAR